MALFNEYYQKFLALNHVHYGIETGIVLVFVFLAVWLGNRLIRAVEAKKEKTKNTQRSIFLRLAVGGLPLARPLMAFFIVHLLYFILPHVGFKPQLYDAVHQLLLAWLLIKTIRILTKKKMATWLIAGVILPMTILSIIDLWQPLMDFLDTLALSVGSYKVSVYSVLEFLFVVMVLFWSVGKVTGFIEQHLKSSRALSVSNRTLVVKLLQIFLYIAAFLLTLDILGIDLTALAVFSGALGVGLGFGLQKITSNFISGLILLFEKSVKSGDMVEMADGTYGLIKQISARFTLIQTYDGKEIMVPNEDFITQQVINWTHSNTEGRLENRIGVAYGTDLKKAKELILEAIEENKNILDHPQTQCNLEEFGDSSINFLIRFWLKDISVGRRRVMGEFLMTVWEKFVDNDIEIPFPQRDLNFKGPITIQYDESGKQPSKKAAPKKKAAKSSSASKSKSKGKK